MQNLILPHESEALKTSIYQFSSRNSDPSPPVNTKPIILKITKI